MTFTMSLWHPLLPMGSSLRTRKVFASLRCMEELIKDQGVKLKMEILPRNVKVKKIKTDLNLAEFPVIVGS